MGVSIFPDTRGARRALPGAETNDDSPRKSSVPTLSTEETQWPQLAVTRFAVMVPMNVTSGAPLSLNSVPLSGEPGYTLIVYWPE
jgi:hypothetical protein